MKVQILRVAKMSAVQIDLYIQFHSSKDSRGASFSSVLLGFLEGGNWKNKFQNIYTYAKGWTILKRTKAEGLKWLDFKTTYKPTVIETLWYWHKEGQMKKNANK